MIGKLTGFAGVAAAHAAKGLPLVPVLLLAAMALMAVVSALEISGWKARLGAVLHHPDRGGEHDTAPCLALMDQVAASGEVLLITKNGPPVAELHPCASTRRPFHRGKLVCSAVILPLAPPAEG